MTSRRKKRKNVSSLPIFSIRTSGIALLIGALGSIAVATGQVDEPGRVDEKSYLSPAYDGPFESTFWVDGKNWSLTIDNVTAFQPTSDGDAVGLEDLEIGCYDCLSYGIGRLEVEQVDELRWRFHIGVTDKKTFAMKIRELNGKTFHLDLTLKGKEGLVGITTLDITVRVGSGDSNDESTSNVSR